MTVDIKRNTEPAESFHGNDNVAGAWLPSAALCLALAQKDLQYAVPIEILLVEDSAGDVRLTREALRDAKVRNNLHIVLDGLEATAYVRREGKYASAPRPDLILLDLNLPKKSGREVLEELKSDERLKTIPVVILTTSSAEEDILRSYQLHANCYITKPVDLDQFLKVIGTIDDFWLSIVKLPKVNAHE